MAPEPHDEDITLTGEMSLADILADSRAGGRPAQLPSLNDGHCHFFSTRFFELLAAQMPGGATGGVTARRRCARAWAGGSGSPEALADRWVASSIASAWGGRC